MEQQVSNAEAPARLAQLEAWGWTIREVQRVGSNQWAIVARCQ